MAGALDLGTLFGSIELEDNYTPALYAIGANTQVAIKSLGQLDVAIKSNAKETMASGVEMQRFVAMHSQLSVAQAQVKAYSAEVSQAAEKIRAAGIAVSQGMVEKLQVATEKLLVAEAGTKKLSVALKEVEKSAADAGAGVLANASKIADAQQRLFTNQKKQAEDADAAVKKAMASSAEATQRAAQLSVQNAEASVKTAEALSKWQNVGSVITEVGRGMRAVGVTMSAAISVPLAAAGAESIKFAGDFEAGMAKVVSLAGASAEEVKNLRGEILKLSGETAIAPEELAKGLFVVESAGFRGAAAMDLMTHSAKMSAIGMGSVEETTRAVVGAMLTFQSTNLTAEQAADQLVKTVQLGNMKVNELVTALARVNPIAAAFGLKFADINASIATFTHLGASTDIAATGIRAILSTMLNDSSKTEKGLKALGVSMSELREEMVTKGLDVALIHLTQRMKELPGGLDKLHDVFPNVRAFVDVLATAGAQEERYAFTTHELLNANNTLNDSFQVTTRTFNFQLASFQTQLHNVGIEIGAVLLPIVTRLLKWFETDMLPIIKAAVEWWAKLPSSIQTATAAFGLFLIAAGPALMFFGEATIGAGHLISAFEKIAGISFAQLILDLFGVERGLSEVALATKTLETAQETLAALKVGGTVASGAALPAIGAGGVGVAATEAGAGAGLLGGMTALELTGYGAIIVALGVAVYELYQHWNDLEKLWENSKGPEVLSLMTDIKNQVKELSGLLNDPVPSGSVLWELYNNLTGLEESRLKFLEIQGILRWMTDSKASNGSVIKELFGDLTGIDQARLKLNEIKGILQWVIDHEKSVKNSSFLPSDTTNLDLASRNLLPFSGVTPGSNVAKIINPVNPFEKSAETTSKAKKAIEDYNKAWSDWAQDSGGWLSILDTLSTEQIKVVDYYLQMGDSVDKVAAKFPNLTKSQIEAVKGTEKLRDAVIELTDAQKTQLNEGFSKGIPASVTAHAEQFMSPILAENYNKELERQYKAIGKIVDAWDDFRSLGATVTDTIAGINAGIRDGAKAAADQGAGVAMLEGMFPDLTRSQADALVKNRTNATNFTNMWEKADDEITKVWMQGYAIRGEIGQQGLGKEIAQIQLATTTEIYEYTKRQKAAGDTAEHIQEMVYAIEAKGAARIAVDRFKWQERSDAELEALRLKDQEVMLGLLGTKQQTELTKIEIALQADLEKLRKQGLDSDTRLVNARIKLAKDEAFAVVAAMDPVWTAWQSLNEDMRKTNASTWGEFLDDTKSFGDAFQTTLIQSMWTPFRNILAGMMADFENLFIAPIMNYFRNVLQQALLNWVSQYTGVSNYLSNSGGGGGGGGSIGNNLVSTAQNLGTKYAFGAIAAHYASTVAAPAVAYGASVATPAVAGTLASHGIAGAATIPNVTSSMAASSGAGGLGAAAGAMGAAAGAGIAGWQLGQWLGSKTESKPLGAAMGAGAGAAAGAAIGSVVPVLGTGIGALVGGIAGAIAGWRAAGKLWDEVKDKQAALVKMFGSTEDEIKSVGEAYALTGHKGTEAEAALHKLWDAKTPQEFDAAMKPIAETLQILKQNTEDLAAASVDSAGRITEAWTRVLDLNKKYGTNAKEVREFITQQTAAIMSGFNDVMAAQKDAVAGYDDIKKAVDDATEAQKKLVESGTASSSQLEKAAKDLKDAIEKQTTAGKNAAGELADLSSEALGTYLTRVAAGASPLDALKDESDALAVLQQEYEDLGIKVEDVGLKQLFTQNTMLRGSGTLFNGISGLTKMMTGLDSIGQETTDMFSAQQRTALQLYTRLQDAAFRAGGTTKDALLPMQDYLHQAEIEAKKLGVPLDAITQQMIDQSKDEGIWKDAITPPPTIQDAIQTLTDTIDDLARALRGLPPITHVHVDETHTVSNGPPETQPPDTSGEERGFALGGVVRAKNFATGGGIRGLNSTDTVPAWLTPGERVLTVAQNKMFESFLAGDQIGNPIFPSIIDTSNPDNGGFARYPWTPPPYVTNRSSGETSTPESSSPPIIDSGQVIHGVGGIGTGSNTGTKSEPMQTYVTFSIKVDGADINDVRGKFIPKLLESIRNDEGGIRTAFESIARKS